MSYTDDYDPTSAEETKRFHKVLDEVTERTAPNDVSLSYEIVPRDDTTVRLETDWTCTVANSDFDYDIWEKKAVLKEMGRIAEEKRHTHPPHIRLRFSMKPLTVRRKKNKLARKSRQRNRK